MKDLFANYDQQTQHSKPQHEEDDLESPKTGADDDHNGSTVDYELDTEKLCSLVWPALAVIGGVDRGLKIGGQCIHKTFSKRGILLGTLKKGYTTVKVQWEHDGSFFFIRLKSVSNNILFLQVTSQTFQYRLYNR